MRKSVSAVAFIQREQRGQVFWLAQWNPKWERYHFVSGHKRADESFRECMIREVGEELNLRAETEFTVATDPLARVEFEAWSESAEAETSYTMELFEVRLNGNPAREKVDGDPMNRWLTKAEIRSHQCADGKPVSATMELLFSKVGWDGLEPSATANDSQD